MDIFAKNNEPIIIKNTNFKKCILFISFPIECHEDELLMVLKNMAFDKSNTYNTDKKIYEINVKNYCLFYRGMITKIGNNYFLELVLHYPSEKSLGKNVLEDNLKFLKDLIYNPYLENGSFSKKEVNDIIDIIKNNIHRNFKEASWYYDYKNDKIIDKDNYLISKVYEDPSLLDKVTPERLYELYKEITNSSPLIFLIGDVNEEKDRKLIKDILLDNKLGTISFLKKYHNFTEVSSLKVKEVKETTKFKTSCLYYNYKVKDMNSERDIAILKIIRNLLDSGQSRILFDNLRKDNDLVYRCGAYVYSSFGSLTLWAFTGKNNIEKCDSCFSEVMKKITDIDFITKKMSLILERAKLEKELMTEKIYDILMEEIDKYIEYKTNSFYDNIKDITPKEVKDFIENRLVLVSKYVGVGEENE